MSAPSDTVTPHAKSQEAILRQKRLFHWQWEASRACLPPRLG
jgi:hypothetical protein